MTITIRFSGKIVMVERRDEERESAHKCPVHRLSHQEFIIPSAFGPKFPSQRQWFQSGRPLSFIRETN